MIYSASEYLGRFRVNRENSFVWVSNGGRTSRTVACSIQIVEELPAAIQLSVAAADIMRDVQIGCIASSREAKIVKTTHCVKKETSLNECSRRNIWIFLEKQTRECAR